MNYLKKALARHMLRHGEKQFICDICSKSFYRKDELKEHIYTHNVAMDQNLHVCPTCGHSANAFLSLKFFVQILQDGMILKEKLELYLVFDLAWSVS
jgi:uncharacterized Zn-finger protein